MNNLWRHDIWELVTPETTLADPLSYEIAEFGFAKYIKVSKDASKSGQEG
jgi:hypothetical protein